MKTKWKSWSEVPRWLRVGIAKEMTCKAEDNEECGFEQAARGYGLAAKELRKAARRPKAPKIAPRLPCKAVNKKTGKHCTRLDSHIGRHWHDEPAGNLHGSPLVWRGYWRNYKVASNGKPKRTAKGRR